LSVSYGSTLLFNSRVLSLLGNRNPEVQDVSRTATKADCGLWGIGTSMADAYDLSRRAMGLLESGVSDEEALAAFAKWYDDVKVMEAGQAESTAQHEEGKTAREFAIEEASEIMDRVVLNGGGKGGCDWEGCREELAEAYERGGLGLYARLVRQQVD